MSIITTLQSLGLSEKEAAIYVALVEIGEGGPGRIAIKSKVKRPTVYLLLEELRKKGLVSKIPYPNKQIFSAKDPRELIAENEARLMAAKLIIPQLMALTNAMYKPRIMFYEDMEGVRELLWYGLEKMKGKELVGFYGHAAHIPKKLLELALEYNEHFKTLDVKLRGIVPEHPSNEQFRKVDAEYNRTVKIVPLEAYDAEMSIDIGDTFVKILSFEHVQGVIIENKHIAQVMKQVFEMVWSTH
ncbi:MAG: hypothetical protein HYT27_01400 [Parcubacteria group bacterium]|nr:hypothetical protein [Parcubacteria group bacterium]